MSFATRGRRRAVIVKACVAEDTITNHWLAGMLPALLGKGAEGFTLNHRRWYRRRPAWKRHLPVVGGWLMSDVDLKRRVEILEEYMGELRDVPVRLAAVESQIVQLRGELQDGFSALRTEMHAQRGELRGEIRAQGDELRTEMRSQREALRTEMHAQREELQTEMRVLGERLRNEMRALNDETRAQMRVLHEEVISRFAVLQEGLANSTRRRRPRKTR